MRTDHGLILGDFAIGNTSGWNNYQTIPANTNTNNNNITGTHTIYITFKSGYPNLAAFQFQQRNTPMPSLTWPSC